MRNKIKASFIKKGLIVILLAALIGFLSFSFLGQKAEEPQYQTATVEKGSLVSRVTASGTISSGNSGSITTSATGVVKEVYVANGDAVTEGQTIAVITPDKETEQNQATAYASYLSAVNSLKQAEQQKISADASMWTAQQSVVSAQNDINYKNDNTTNPETQNTYTDLEKQNIESSLIQSQKSFAAAEKTYKEADAAIAAANAQVTSSWLTYEQTSSTITAPSAGTVSNLALTPGLAIASSDSSSSNSTESSSSTTNTSSTQSYGMIAMEGGILQASVNLSEIDVTQVKPGQKVTLTLDAFPDKTFTGKVAAINTNGSVSSGVTTYPTTIIFDETTIETIYPNMAVSANIITDIQSNVLLIPSSALQTSNGTSTVRVVKEGKLSTVTVEVGKSNDTQTAITSGLTSGDTVVTSTSSTGNTNSTSTTSPFGGTGLGGGGMMIRR
ncbi:MAG: efflux RND transporter periplasmic adaptor subunit [Patescibacteria group bacterium]